MIRSEDHRFALRNIMHITIVESIKDPVENIYDDLKCAVEQMNLILFYKESNFTARILNVDRHA